MCRMLCFRILCGLRLSPMVKPLKFFSAFATQRSGLGAHLGIGRSIYSGKPNLPTRALYRGSERIGSNEG